MGEEITIELPDTSIEESAPIAEAIVIDELAALRDAERERTNADILAAAALAQVAHDLAQGAHDRIDGHATDHTASEVVAAEIVADAIAEIEIEPEPVAEIESEPEPEHHEDKKPNREHWFYR